ncbi:MAG: glycosyltransferase [Betaproteobacteria bacterium]|nr:glycosyltransferase [Betaproteobacteria bacterium]
MARGNELLYATYRIRIMRLTGRINSEKLAEIQAILVRNNFVEEAKVAALLFLGSNDDMYHYLLGRKRNFSLVLPIENSEIVDFRRVKPAKVSIIVSVYNGADKIDTFLSGLERFTERSKAISEIVFVDSNSPDNTREVLLARLQQAKQRGIDALYVRTSKRETIQRAWNRGIGISNGHYLAFLGVDEMKRPDAIRSSGRLS